MGAEQQKTETCPVLELQTPESGDKQRWSSSWRPICQRICHGRSFIVHKRTRRSEADATEEWIHVSHERMIIPCSFVSLLVLVSVLISLLSHAAVSQQNTSLDLTGSFSCLHNGFSICL